MRKNTKQPRLTRLVCGQFYPAIMNRNGYWFIRVNDEYVAEHRFIVENSGRKLNEFECVHHINGIKWDNRLENLQVFASAGEHNLEHIRLEEKRMTEERFPCLVSLTLDPK